MVNRRSLIKGTAWAAPVVVASATTPVYASSPEPAQVCSTISIGPYNGESNTYPLSVSFGGSKSDQFSELVVTVEYTSTDSCPDSTVGLYNPCDGMSGTGESTCNAVAQGDGTNKITYSQSVSGMYFDYQQLDCGACPFSAYLINGVPEGAVIKLESAATEEDPAWTYVFTLGGFGSERPAVVELSRSASLPAGLNVSYPLPEK